MRSFLISVIISGAVFKEHGAVEREWLNLFSIYCRHQRDPATMVTRVSQLLEKYFPLFHIIVYFHTFSFSAQYTVPKKKKNPAAHISATSGVYVHPPFNLYR